MFMFYIFITIISIAILKSLRWGKHHTNYKYKCDTFFHLFIKSTSAVWRHMSSDGRGGFYTNDGHISSDGRGGYYLPDGGHMSSDGK